MTIKDVEQLTAITRQNIRFYEKEGLITPCRNPENQYREYSEDDIKTLHRIRLYRKLNVSIEDIRSVENRTLPLERCMEQCISNTEREMVRLTKIKEVCEELRKQVLEGKSPDVEKTLEEIDAYEKSGYQFTDISKDYWNMAVVHDVRSLNRQVVKALLLSFIAVLVCNILYFLLLKPQWVTMIPATVIGYIAAWVYWAGKNKAVLRKHIRFMRVSAGVCLVSAVIGVLLYIIVNGCISATVMIFPNPRIMATENDLTGTAFLWLFITSFFRDCFYSLICCILFYDTYKQKSIISALALSSLLFALTCMNPYAAVGYLMIGICQGLLYEMTDSIIVSILPILSESVCSGILSIMGLWFPDALPGILKTADISQLFPWILIAILLILILLYAVSRLTGKKIDWSLEWEKSRSLPAPPVDGTTILDQKAFREIEKERKRGYRLADGYLATAIFITLWYMTSVLRH